MNAHKKRPVSTQTFEAMKLRFLDQNAITNLVGKKIKPFTLPNSVVF
jgi:hypothetical protein